VKGDGKGGGLALFYADDISVEMLSFRKRHIDVHVNGGLFNHK
jgi:hypothetical protein